MPHIYIKEKNILKTDFQPFMQHFTEACINAGFQKKTDFFPSYRFHVRSLFCRLLLIIYKVVAKLFPDLIEQQRNKKALMIASNGGMILPNAFPYFLKYEIVPMLWDVWPHSWENIYDNIKLFNIKTVFVTVRQFAEKLQDDLQINAYWIPEWINTSLYKKGHNLLERSYDIIEIGRQHKEYHAMLMKLYKDNKLVGYKTSKINLDGTLNSNNLMFPKFEDMVEALPQYKIMICFPQCDTNPDRSGKLETLTQRYWEAMLSGCLMLGRAPQELIDFIGYNPVVNIDWEHQEYQLQSILSDISKYQGLVDKNYLIAMEKGSWSSRISMIKSYLAQNGYSYDE